MSNSCEFEALKDGLALTWTKLRQINTYLKVRGDSKMITEHLNSFTRITAHQLVLTATRVKELANI